MAEPQLLLEKTDGYAVLTLNRPDARNALSPQLLQDLCVAFRDLQADAQVRAVILTGAGSAFCAGLDLKAMSGDAAGLGVYDIHGAHDIVAAMTAFDRPIIVGVNGVAATGGFELALMGDILLASEAARFADTHARVGLAPGWGLSQKLARIIGPSRAREAHFTGNFIGAAQAAEWGLVSRTVPAGDLLEECRALARDIVGCVPATVRVYKQLVNDGLEMSLAAGLVMERNVMGAVNRRVSGDAIAERRKAVQQRGREQA
ncbi:MAG: enoyl-CoA hydratase [Halioglobus sp.]|mgnify:CR=1 FL=1|nr:enoyl-CoA hydratase [Halioglobus sp.]